MSGQFDALIPPDMARKAEQVGVAKANFAGPQLFMLAVLAGAFIALGAVFATTVISGNALGFGVTRLLGGLAFSLGLILVMVAGAELFTGNNLIVMAAASGKVSSGKLLRNWVIVYAGNFVGSIATAALVFVSGHYRFGNGAIGQSALAIARAKVELDPLQALFLGILCNVLVCLAVWLCMSARSTTDKVLAIVFPITAFVAAGFEHSVANMYFIPEGIFIRIGAPAEFWHQIGAAATDYASLTWTRFALSNLLPVTLGNIIGGSVLVGMVYWYVYLRSRDPRE